MRWLPAAVAVLSVLAMTGCPSEFGKGGRIDKAVERDVRSQLGVVGCTEQRKHEVCDGPNRDYDKCQACGG